MSRAINALVGGIPLLALSTLMVHEARAAETGNLRGRVLDEQGLAVPGVLVTVSGPGIAGERQVETDAEGEFRILSLPPGSHRLRVEKAGFANLVVQVQVRLDETAFVPVTLQLATGTQEIVVEADLPVIDTTRSAVSTEIRDTQLQNLPVARSYQDAVNMVPGVYGRVDTEGGGPGSGNPSVRGEGGYGNNYLVDGISTRDPATKTFGTNVNFDSIETIQVYTDGAPAEFGQATGMMVNVATKDGGDEHHGTAGYWISAPASWGKYKILDLDLGREVLKEKRSFLNHEVSLTAGGPIIKEKLWYFASLDLGLDRINYEAMPPDHPYTSRSIGGFGKLTWFLTPDLQLQYQFNGQTTHIENYETSGLYAQSAQAIYDSRDLGHIATLRWFPSTRQELEIKGSYLPSSIDVVPTSGVQDPPSIQNTLTGEYFGNYDSFDYNSRSRLGGSLKFTQLVDRFLGEHRFKTGGEYWVLHDARELVYTGPGDGVQYYVAPGEGYDCPEEAGIEDCVGYRTYQQAGELGHEGNVLGLFLQDDWRPVDPLTLNLGVRADNEILYQNAGQKVIDQWMPAPRLGLAWDITNDSKTLFTVNYGRYYDIAGNSFADWGDTRSAYVYKEYAYNPDIGDYELIWEQNNETDPLVYCTESSLDGYVQHLKKDYGYTAAQASTERKKAERYCDGTLRPYHLDKVVVGIKREIIPLLALGIKGIWSETRNIPEDININDTTWVIANTPAKYRDYRALELTLERKYDERWYAMGSYTLSASRGHMPGQFELSSGGQTGSGGNDVGVYLDDVNESATRAFYYENGYAWVPDGLYGLGTVKDDQGYYGYLPYHSFHQVKLSGFYTFEFGTTLGLVYEFDSGHAWQKRAYVDLYQDYYGFPEGRGSRFMPAVHYIDVRVAHAFDFGNDRSLELMVDIFNLPDFEAPITYYENDNASFGTTLYRQAPRSVRAGLKLTY